MNLILIAVMILGSQALIGWQCYQSGKAAGRADECEDRARLAAERRNTP